MNYRATKDPNTRHLLTRAIHLLWISRFQMTVQSAVLP
jgi:hypothetical protein